MYNDIKLEKSLYSITGKTFTQALAELDPDSNYADTELRGLDAFERQLKRFDIHVSGAGSDMVEKFFVTAQSAVLFPEFVRRAIKKGIDETAITSDICAAVSRTDSSDFRGLTLTKSGSGSVAEAGELPVTKVRLSSTSKQLKKFARILSCSYESVRKQRIDTFAVALRELGASVARELNSYALEELSTGVTPASAAGAAPTYAELAKFWSSMTDHNMNVMICTPSLMASILALEEMKFCTGEYMANGRVKTPYGVTLIKCSQTEDKTIIGLDSTCAAELILGTDIVVDIDKLISTQCDEISCSIMAGVSKLTADAVKVLETV